jgi:hypothetical protein
MLKLIPVAVFLLASLSPLSGMQIQTAYTRHYQEDEIRTVGQYFTSKFLRLGFRTIVASDPEVPTGQYFIIRTKGSPASKPVAAHMILYRTDSKDPQEWTWSLENVQLDKWLYLGLTGADWPDEEVQPLAWRLELRDAGGAVVASWNSFLWEQ